jgi:hypothetical protein
MNEKIIYICPMSKNIRLVTPIEEENNGVVVFS